MTASHKKSLTYRLIEAVNSVAVIEKLGTNDTGEYNYVRASDVARAFRKELKKRHILVTPDEKEITGRTVQTPGGPQSMITVKIDFYFHCGLTGEVLGPRRSVGQAIDAGDKGLYKAKTGAMKSFLRLLSLLPDKDPEADQTVDQLTQPSKTEKKAAAKPEPKPYRERHPEHPLDLHQAKAITDSLRITGKTEEQFCERFAVETVRGVKRGQFREAFAWAMERETPTVEAKKENWKAQAIVEAMDHVAVDEVAI